MRRLYLQFYLTIVASLILVVVTAGTLWRFSADLSPIKQAFEMAGELAAASLAPADAPNEAQQKAIKRLAERLHTDLTLFSPNREPIAVAGRLLPTPRGAPDQGGWVHGTSGEAWWVRLPDERWLVARIPPHHRHPGLALVVFLGAIALAVAAGAFPVARRITRRLERLQSGVESLGAGDLSARVKIEGRDEVARLAESFNRAATRIEDLVKAHRMLLANASHELRTPLARIRLGLEMLHKTDNQNRRFDLEKDIAELDQLIDEILLVSRLEADKGLQAEEEIDLLALVAEECSHYENCSVRGAPVMVRGDSRLLRRMTRNLLENATRHGVLPIEVEVQSHNKQAVLMVCDHGPGIAASERERIFVPFYRSPGSVEGAGLGLALVRQIARQHRGEACLGPGGKLASCFTITLPSSQPAVS
jgi:signal transduction histidine kinase